MLLNYQKSENDTVQTSLIKEPNTILAFNDFIQDLSNLNLVYSSEETSDILLQKIQSLKQAPPPNACSWISLNKLFYLFVTIYSQPFIRVRMYPFGHS